MSQRLNEYFAEEAADYLQQLSALLSAPTDPDPVRFLRLATGVRGSTKMAGADDLADLAGRFEGLARGLIEGSADWSDQAEVSRRTVSEMLALVHSIERWGEAETARVRAAAMLWEDSDSRREPQSDEPEVVPIESLFYDDDGPHIIEPEAATGSGADSGGEWSTDDEPDLPLVSIEELLFHGEGALRAALALRPAFDGLARGETPSDRPAQDLVEELFDLIALGLSAETPEA